MQTVQKPMKTCCKRSAFHSCAQISLFRQNSHKRTKATSESTVSITFRPWMLIPTEMPSPPKAEIWNDVSDFSEIWILNSEASLYNSKLDQRTTWKSITNCRLEPDQRTKDIATKTQFIFLSISNKLSHTGWKSNWSKQICRAVAYNMVSFTTSQVWLIVQYKG